MAGRPKKPPGKRMDSELRIRLTPAQRKTVDAAARKLTLESSTWARTVVLREAEKIIGPLADPAGLPIESPMQGRDRQK